MRIVIAVVMFIRVLFASRATIFAENLKMTIAAAWAVGPPAPDD
jgi:hypothetical protein